MGFLFWLVGAVVCLWRYLCHYLDCVFVFVVLVCVFCSLVFVVVTRGVFYFGFGKLCCCVGWQGYELVLCLIVLSSGWYVFVAGSAGVRDCPMGGKWGVCGAF